MTRPDSGRASERLYTRTFFIISLGHLFLAISILSLIPELSRFVSEQLHGDKTDVGLVFSAAILGGLLLRPLTGVMLDRYGRRKVFALGGLIAAAGYPAYVLVTELGPLLYALRVCHGVGMGALFATLFTYASDITPAERRTEGLAVFGALGLLGMAIGPPMGERLVEHWSFEGFCWVMCAVSATGSLLTVICPETRPEDGATPSLGWRGQLAVYRTRSLWVLWVVTALWGTVLGISFAFTERLCEVRNFPEYFEFFVPYGLTAVLLRFVGGKVPDKLGPGRVLVPCLVIHAAGACLLAESHSVMMLRIAGILYGTAHGYIFPILNALVVNRCEKTQVGAAVAAYTTVIDLGPVFLSFAAGWVADTYSFRLLFWILGGLCLLAAMVYVAVERPYSAAPTVIGANSGSASTDS